MNLLPFVVTFALVPFVPVRVVLTCATIFAVWLLLSLIAHFLIFRPLFRRNERL
jgi:hypothetical protein